MNAVQVVRDYFEAMNAHDAIKAASYMTDDYVESDFLPQVPPNNKQQTVKTNTGLFQAFPDIHFNIQQMTEQDDQVIVETQVTGTHKGPLTTIPGMPPIPAPGKKFSVPDKLVFTMRGNRIAAQRFESPTNGGPAEAFKQLGIQAQA